MARRAVFGRSLTVPCAVGMVRQVPAVGQRVVAAERQHVPALALLGPVTGAGVAAHARQCGHDIADEADLVFVLLSADLHRHMAYGAVEAELHHTAAVGDQPNIDQQPFNCLSSCRRVVTFSVIAAAPRSAL
jgi:hypothetical protein